MRKIINGRTYNTETSRPIGTRDNGGNYSNFSWCEKTLYRNTKGAYFIHGRGGAMSEFATRRGDDVGPGEKIEPLTEEEAKVWAEKHLTPEEYEAEWGEPEEADAGDLVTRERVTFSLDGELVPMMRELSAKKGIPMSRMIDQAVRAMWFPEE